LEFRREQAIRALGDLGIEWGPTTNDQLVDLGGPISPAQAAVEIREAAAEYEPRVRAVTGATAPYQLSIETADVDAYWHYWVDGAGSEVRLRLNVGRAKFTHVKSRQFALHEVLGHGLQAANIAQHSHQHDVPWVRLFSVHASQQTLLEGLAQALPLFICPDDEALIASVKLDHYLQLVRGNIHLALDDGDLDHMAAQARDLVPFWSDEEISDTFTDRSTSPLLRSYLWSYGAGLDWFVNLFEEGPIAFRTLQIAYRQPLRPTELLDIWPEGPLASSSNSKPSLPRNPLRPS
jgi:hypothetical protein